MKFIEPSHAVHSRSFQHSRIFGYNLIVVRLESQPHLIRVPAFLMREFCLLLGNVLLLKTRTSRGVGEHLGVAAAVQSYEQEGRLVDGPTTCDHAMVLQDDASTGRTQCFCDPFAFFCRQDRASVARVDGQIVVEPQGVLVEHLDRTPEATERLAVDTVGVTGRIQVRSCPVDGAVDGERRPIDGALCAAGQDFAILAHQHKVRDPDLREVR